MWKIVVILLPCLAWASFVTVCTDDQWIELNDPKIFVVASGMAPSESRIIGGLEVDRHSVPYQAALFIEFSRGRSFCGGSLISHSHVLTAAHCMHKAKLVEVVLGAHDIRKNETSQFHVTCEDITVHPEWNYQKLENDIALIKLPQPVTLNKYISPVSLATSGSFVDSNALLTGWGKTSDLSTVSNVLNQVNLPILENERCKSFYEDIINNSHICTSGVELKGGCNGDSGGPLVVDGHQVGIVSFGSNRCTKGYPTVFTRVTEFADWISKNCNVTRV
ncbi:hypothetical protein HUJ05_002107 [Dendroctonus ponderosae]|nr:hypothetical protein HUJ05_002107 [Dendroctonus ponderosae]